MALLIKHLFIFSLCIPFAALAKKITLPNGRTTDHNVLALQWPRSLNPASTLLQFTLHGVWPGDSGNIKKFLADCVINSSIPPAVLKKYMTDLQKYWPDVQSGHDQRFWEHEWKKHGTCSGVSAADYFSNAILLVKLFDIVGDLQNAKISHGASVTHPANDFVKAFRSTHGVDAVVVCDGNKLKEFRINFTNDIPPMMQNMNAPFTVGCSANIELV